MPIAGSNLRAMGTSTRDNCTFWAGGCRRQCRPWLRLDSLYTRRRNVRK